MRRRIWARRSPIGTPELTRQTRRIAVPEAKTKARPFAWTEFYEEVAERLLDYCDNRVTLVEQIRRVASPLPVVNDLEGDRFSDGSVGPMRDIDPFTTMATFNRIMKAEHRRAMASGLARFLGVETPVPLDFGTVQAPTLHPQRSWFFGYSKDRREGDIDTLWEAFLAARDFAASPDGPRTRARLIAAYDAARQVWGVKWNLSMGFYWAHPEKFPSLDKWGRAYVTDRLDIPLPPRIDGAGYVDLIRQLTGLFAEDNCPVHSFPEMCAEAWPRNKKRDEEHPPPPADDQDARTAEANEIAEPRFQQQSDIYGVGDIVDDGCFLDQPRIELLLERLRSKKNLILQGPPGTGKTWLARRLAYALVQRRDPRRVRTVQFHPNLSYEDFVRGYRPSGDGRLAPVDGVFMQVVDKAHREQEACFVLVVEEINRGNPAQIFGELLTLLEADKRQPDDALELSYPDPIDGSNRPVYVPPNLYVVGTMNLADRSLALVDLALRRRFAFAELEPQLGARWLEWIVEHRNVDRELARDIQSRIKALNDVIENDESLGTQFRLGHSYVTPAERLEGDTTREWFERVARTEIGPQLDEYWFDSPKTARERLEDLLSGW